MLYERYLGFILPDGMLDFFELVWMETMSLTAREAKKKVAHTGILHIHLIDVESYRWRYGRHPFAPHRWQKGLKATRCQLWVLEKEVRLSLML